jgi:hypothetical protein
MNNSDKHEHRKYKDSQLEELDEQIVDRVQETIAVVFVLVIATIILYSTVPCPSWCVPYSTTAL